MEEAKASSLQNRVNYYSTTVILRGGSDAIQSGFLVEVSASFYAMVEELYDKFVKATSKPDDKAQLILKTDSMEHFVSTPLRKVDELTVDHLMVTLEKTQNSGVSIKFSDKLVIEFIHLRLDKAWNLPGGVRRRDLLYFNSHYQKQSCRSMVAVGVNSCLPASCIVGAAHERMLAARNMKPPDEETLINCTHLYKKLVDNPGRNNELKRRVSALCDEAGIRYGTPGDLTHLPIFERILDISFKVVSIPDQLKIVYKGEEHPQREYVYLVYSQPVGSSDSVIGHYDLITNVRGFFGKPYYCNACDVSYHDIYNHRCKGTIEFWCFSCYQADCKPSKNPTSCKECSAKLHSPDCERKHVGMRCGKKWKCPHCKKLLYKKKVYDSSIKGQRYQTNEEVELAHDCDRYYCEECKVEVENNHKCFIKRIKFKSKIQKFLFFDLETDQSTKKHIVNYIHLIYYHQSEDEQKWEEQALKWKRKQYRLEQELEIMNTREVTVTAADDKEELSNKIQETVQDLIELDESIVEYEEYLSKDEEWQGEWVELNYSGQDCLLTFCKDLVTQFAGYTCVAHNLKGFDGVFILRTFLENGVIPTVICKGLKLLEIRANYADLRFIDSFNFLPMALSKLPDAFGLDCGNKGYFPHFFNRPENANYADAYPEPKYYGVSQMSTDQREKFYIWYKKQEGKKFDFKQQMSEYCQQDVVILKESCMAYRRLMCQETGADPFSYVTLASVCNAVYRVRYMPLKTIARVPPSGYINAKYSDEGYEWVEYLRRFGNVPNMQHAVNGGEVQIGRYLVDGFDKTTNTIYEYYGCFFHGCKNCFPLALKNPDTKKRMLQVYTETKHRELWLKNQGYRFVCIWGCEWKKMKGEDHELFDKVKSMKLPKPLDPRHAFYGGRTETFKLWSNDAPIAYYDVTSLYPWVNCTQKYPVGHPQIILSDFRDISEYFGLMKCVVLPPRDLYIPVLPIHAGPTGKLLFPLCGKCAETFDKGTCRHTDADRQIEGTWFSEEIKLALEKGYQLITIYSVWHFPETTTELFAPYIRAFYKKKLLSSKLPYDTQEEIEAFIEEVKEKESIEILNVSEFKENAGLRQITKLMLNNLWGRFGMNENMSTSQFITDFQNLEKITEDVTKEVQAVRIINEKIVQIVSKSSDTEFLQCSTSTNIYIALMTTAWARIRLYRELDKVNRRALYCDTDSVIYKETPNPSENLLLGNFLGELTSELDRKDHIVEFVSGGPKNYGFITSVGKATVKIKGFSLNSTNGPAFSFGNIKNIILKGVASFIPENQLLDNSNSINSVPSDSSPCRKLRRVDSRDKLYTQHMRDPENATAIVTDNCISVFNPVRIFRTKSWEILQKSEQKLYRFFFDKRCISPTTLDTFPYGYLGK